MNKYKILSSLTVAGVAGMVAALQPALAADGIDVTMHGFVTSAYQFTDERAHYLAEINESGIDDRGSDHGSKFGFNITTDFNDKTHMAGQFFAGASEGYETDLDWAFVTYDVTDAFSVRMGKVKYGGSLYSDVIDVGALYQWIEAPVYVYGEETSNGNYESFNGISALYNLESGDVTYTAELYLGSVGGQENIYRKKFKGVALTANWDDKVIFKANSNSSHMVADDEALNAQLGVANAVLSVDPLDDAALDIVDEVAEAFLKDGQDHEITNVGLSVDINNVIFVAESVSVEMGAYDEGKADANYAMLGYRMGKFTPSITVASIEKGEPVFSEESYTKFGVRYDLTRNVDIKFEMTDISIDTGTGLFMPPPLPLDNDVKMYGISVDATF